MLTFLPKSTEFFLDLKEKPVSNFRLDGFSYRGSKNLVVSRGFFTVEVLVNLLSPNGDQHQFSRNDIHTLSRDKVTGINELMIT